MKLLNQKAGWTRTKWRRSHGARATSCRASGPRGERQSVKIKMNEIAKHREAWMADPEYRRKASSEGITGYLRVRLKAFQDGWDPFVENQWVPRWP